jgi:hypothetical protein
MGKVWGRTRTGPTKRMRRTPAVGILFCNLIRRDRIDEYTMFVERDNSLSGAVMAGFRATRWSVALLSAEIAAEGRLGP